MVDQRLPYPLIKYLKLNSDRLEEVIAQYPFYLFPKIAKILNIAKSEDLTISELNCFGFKQDKLRQYSEIYTTIDYIYKLEKEDKTDIVKRSIDSDFSSGIRYEDSSSSNVLEIEPECEFQDKEEHMKPIDDPTDTDEDTKPKKINSNIEEAENASEFIMDISDNKIETDIDHILLNSDIQFNSPQNEPLPNNNVNKESIEITLKDQNDKELKQMMHSLEFQFSEAEMEDTHPNEERPNNKIEDSMNATESIEIPEILDPLNLEKELEKLDIDSLIEDNWNAIETKKTESKIKDQSSHEEVVNEDIISEDKKSSHKEAIETEYKNDFSSWLNMLNNDSEPITPKNDLSISNPKNNYHIETEDKEVNGPNELESPPPESSTLNIDHDEELEGVLQDDFFKTQVENKKTSRKTPDDDRIQDKAQNSLEPLDVTSEAMAILYIQQGNLTKAIEMYKKLIDEFPQKSGFFASQIEKLSK